MLVPLDPIVAPLRVTDPVMGQETFTPLPLMANAGLENVMAGLGVPGRSPAKETLVWAAFSVTTTPTVSVMVPPIVMPNSTQVLNAADSVPPTSVTKGLLWTVDEAFPVRLMVPEVVHWVTVGGIEADALGTKFPWTSRADAFCCAVTRAGPKESEITSDRPVACAEVSVVPTVVGVSGAAGAAAEVVEDLLQPEQTTTAASSPADKTDVIFIVLIP